jgi:6-phosphogluconolactonase
MPAISRFDSLEAAADRAAGLLAEALSSGLAARDRASLVATGGSTPGPVYDRLARRPLDWPRIEVVLSDERWVEPDEPASNERLVRRRLLVGPAAEARFVALKTAAATPSEAEAEVQNKILAMPRPFDAVLLGMGEDGHIASLFPGMKGLGEGLKLASPRLCMAAEPGEAGAPPREARLGLTLSALAAARAVVIFITGPAKWAALERAMAGEDALDMPVRALLASPAPVEIVWAES